jgi:hypothetical protein
MTLKQITMVLMASGLIVSFGCQKPPTTQLFVVQLGGKVGYIDKTGRVVIQPKFDSAKLFAEGMAAVQVGSFESGSHKGLGKWGYIDQTGRLVIAPKFVSAEDFSDGLALTNTEVGMWEAVYVDKTGKVVISPKQVFPGPKDSAHGWLTSSFHENLALIEDHENGTKYGYINTHGKIAVTPQFDNAYDFNEGVAQVLVFGQGAKTGLIDKSGRLVADPTDICTPLFAGELHFSEGYAAAKRDCFGLWGFIDKSGQFVIEPRFSSASVFREDLAIVGFDVPGATADEPGSYFSGMQVFGDWGLDYSSKRYGYIHKSGVLVIPSQFEGAGVFSEGLAAVKLHGKCGYIDRTGRLLISPRFDTAHPFSGGLAAVSVGDKRGYIDKTGTYVWNPTN